VAKSYYFIFGEEASDIIARAGFSYFLENMEDIPHGIYHFKDGDSPFKLLDSYTGWNDFFIITESEWEQYHEELNSKASQETEQPINREDNFII
jgi:hypothetical protein